MNHLIWMVLAMLCQNPSHRVGTPGCDKVHVVIMSNPDDGTGETGQVPPKLPPPPPPTPPTGS